MTIYKAPKKAKKPLVIKPVKADFHLDDLVLDSASFAGVAQDRFELASQATCPHPTRPGGFRSWKSSLTGR
jgi:hypothetical protein